MGSLATPPRPASYDKKVALVLQGGGALGSYQAGVFEALSISDYPPDWVAGISIGAVNAAIIAGNPPERRVARPRQFWEGITASPAWWPAWLGDAPGAGWGDHRQAAVAAALLFGQPGFFAPRPPIEWLFDPAPTSLYDTAALKGTLESLVDFDRINAREVRFSVGERHDFMAPVAFDPVRKTPTGAFQVKWQSIPTALGYFATAMGQGENQNDVVMWSSSEVQEMGHALMDYLPPNEVQRLIKERIVMNPQTSECSVPAGIFKGEGAMFNFIAFGDELNVVHPPRPKDPKQIWEQQYAVKVRLKSTGMTMLSERSMDVGRGPASRDTGSEPSEGRAAGSQAPRVPSATDAVKEGVNILRGIFGR